MPQCQFPVFCCFFVSEKLHRKYSQNWMKQKPVIQKFTEASREPKRRWKGSTCRPHSRAAWPRPWPRPLCVRPPRSTSDDAPSPIKTPRREKPKHPINFLETHRDPPAIVDPRSGGSRSSSRYPAGEGNRHRRSSSLPCLPPAR
jgi:hypothetical protein